MQNFIIYNEVTFTEIHKIYRGRKKGTIEYVGISKINKNMISYVYNHVRNVSQLDHKHIAKWHEWYETYQCLWVIMELCTTGTLERVLHEDNFLSDSLICHYGRSMVSAMKYLHGQNIIYADWRPNKILITDKGIAKLFDFSYARRVGEDFFKVLDEFSDEDFAISTKSISGLCRKAYPYLPLEAYSRDTLDLQTDIYGFGCLLYQMTFGKLPISEANEKLQYASLKKGLIKFDEQRQISAAHLEVMKKCLETDQKNRYCTRELYNHVFWKPETSNPTVKRPTLREKGSPTLNRNSWRNTVFDDRKREGIVIEQLPDAPKEMKDDAKRQMVLPLNINSKGSFILHSEKLNNGTDSEAPTDDETHNSVIINNIAPTPREQKNFCIDDKCLDVTSSMIERDPHLFEIRAYLASKYPWGNDSSTCPKMKMPPKPGETSPASNEDSPIRYDWVPRPIDEYGKWSVIYADTFIEHNLIPKDFQFEKLSKEIMKSMSETDVEVNILHLQCLISDMHNTPEAHQVNLLKYSCWLISYMTSIKSKRKHFLFEHSESTESIGSNLLSNFLAIVTKCLLCRNSGLDPFATYGRSLVIWYAKTISILAYKILQISISHYDELLVAEKKNATASMKEEVRVSMSNAKELIVDTFKQTSENIPQLISYFQQSLERYESNAEFYTTQVIVISELANLHLAMHGILINMFYKHHIDDNILSEINLERIGWDEICQLLLGNISPDCQPGRIRASGENQKASSKALVYLLLTPFGCNLAQNVLNTLSHEKGESLLKIRENFKAFVSAFANRNVVHVLWSISTNFADKNDTIRENSAIALTSLINYRSGLFYDGIIDRVSPMVFIQALEQSSNTNIQEKIISLTALGVTQWSARSYGAMKTTLQQKLSKYVRDLDKQTIRNTKAHEALMRLPEFYRAIFRCFDIPHTIIRAKIYLIAAAFVSFNPSNALPIACKMKLGACLERDSAINYDEAIRENSVNLYLKECANHFHDIISGYAIPKICYGICDSLGITTHSNFRTYSERERFMERWLPAYSCIAGLMLSFKKLRKTLLLSERCINDKVSLEFLPMSVTSLKQSCSNRRVNFIIFLGGLLNHWSKPIIKSESDKANNSNFELQVTRDGSIENQLLSITLSTIEDIAQMHDVLIERKPHLIVNVLNNLVKLTLSTDIQAICVKITLDMHRSWEKETRMARHKSTLFLTNPEPEAFKKTGRDPIRVTAILGTGSLQQDPNFFKIPKLASPDYETIAEMWSLVENLMKPYS